jgi:hypothetical protein
MLNLKFVGQYNKEMGEKLEKDQKSKEVGKEEAKVRMRKQKINK